MSVLIVLMGGWRWWLAELAACGDRSCEVRVSVLEVRRFERKESQ